MQRLIRGIEVFASLSLGFVTLVTFTAVVLRYGFNSSLPDAFDLVRLSQGVALAWGIALATARSEHIAVDIDWSRFSPAFARFTELFGRLAAAGFLIVLSWVMATRALRTFHSGLATAELRIAVWPVNLVIAAGICAAAALALVVLFRRNGTTS